MVIYGEILFLENFLTGGLLLWLTQRLCVCRAGRFRFFMGAALCGLYAFTLFQDNLNAGAALLQKLLFSVVLIRLTFGGANRRVIAGRTGAFYMVSFAMGGITMGLAGLLTAPAAAANGSFYLEQLTFLHIAAGCLATALSVHLLFSFIREKLRCFATAAKVSVAFCGNILNAEGFVDTGNLLRDPESGNPVCLLQEEFGRHLLEQALPESQWEAVRSVWQEGRSTELLAKQSVPGEFHFIAYQGAGGESGRLLAFRPDYVEVSKEGPSRRYQAVLALPRGMQMPAQGGRRYQVLLHSFLTGEQLHFAE